jgi:Raf kinase inhibitor-like YbhB/YbcL family protein
MKHVLFLSIALGLVACGGSCPDGGTTPAASASRPMLYAEVDAPETLNVTLDGLEGGALTDAHVFSGFGCTGENHSPAIAWGGAPEGTQSFLVEVHDPDAPTGVGWFHWIVADVPAGTESLAFDQSALGLPAGSVETRTDFGAPGWGGPCPPPGPAHRYVVTVYAMDVPSLGVDATTVPPVVRFMMRGHVLALGRAVGTYARAE